MALTRRWWGVSMIGLLLSGCASDLAQDFRPTHSLAMDISDTPTARLARSQVSDGKPRNPIQDLEKPLNFKPQENNTPLIAPPPNSGSGVIPVSLASRGTVRVRVRAWVNGRPIFDDEVLQMAGPDMRNLYRLPDSQRDAKMAELFNTVIDQIVDQELLYQDAVKRLEKINPNALVKMKDYVDNEFDKTLKRMRDSKVPEDQIREIEPTARRLLERQLISTEYVRSRIMDGIKHGVNMDSVREYYETHKNEFMTVDKVIWQDIFIPIGANLPTVEAAKRFAEEEINRCRMPGDFDKLMVYNQGDSALRGGEGMGTRLSKKVVTVKDGVTKEELVAGDIRPAELDQYLGKLREGEIGPVVPFSTGVHLIRVTKREYEGQMPLDEKVQKTITKKLEGELADREYRRIVRELKQRAVVRIERNEK